MQPPTPPTSRQSLAFLPATKFGPCLTFTELTTSPNAAYVCRFGTFCTTRNLRPVKLACSYSSATIEIGAIWKVAGCHRRAPEATPRRAEPRLCPEPRHPAASRHHRRRRRRSHAAAVADGASRDHRRSYRCRHAAGAPWDRRGSYRCRHAAAETAGAPWDHRRSCRCRHSAVEARQRPSTGVIGRKAGLSGCGACGRDSVERIAAGGNRGAAAVGGQRACPRYRRRIGHRSGAQRRHPGRPRCRCRQGGGRRAAIDAAVRVRAGRHWPAEGLGCGGRASQEAVERIGVRHPGTRDARGGSGQGCLRAGCGTRGVNARVALRTALEPLRQIGQGGGGCTRYGAPTRTPVHWRLREARRPRLRGAPRPAGARRRGWP